MPSRYTPVYRHAKALTLASDAITRVDPRNALARPSKSPGINLPKTPWKRLHKPRMRDQARRSLAPTPGDTEIDPTQPPPTRPDRSTPRFFADQLPDRPGTQIVLPEDQARHARRVMRLAAGDAVQLIDGSGRLAQATLAEGDGPGVVCAVTAIQHMPRPRPRIELATAIPKGPRADTMVNDLAQLGADTLIPLATRHSVVDPGPKKIDRFRKAAVAACKQSLRAWLMKVHAKTAFEQALDGDADLKLITDPDAEPLADLAQKLAAFSAVRVLVGPEGGWHADELAAAEHAGFVRWRISPNVLRVETAASAAVAILRGSA